MNLKERCQIVFKAGYQCGKTSFRTLAQKTQISKSGCAASEVPSEFSAHQAVVYIDCIIASKRGISIENRSSGRPKPDLIGCGS